MSVAQYLNVLLALLPKGDAWPTDLDSDMAGLMHGIAEEFARIDSRCTDVINESNPSMSAELLNEWEEQLGLPLPCVPAAQTLIERKAAVMQMYRAFGGQSRQFFIELAAALGYTITIHEFTPLLAGFVAGDEASGEDWAYTWQVNAPETTVKHFTVGTSGAGEALATWGNEALECSIKRLVHAHRIVQFSYS